MQERWLVAVDMDGTLLNTETEDRLRAREIAALEAVRAAGHAVVICTGRNSRSLDRLLDRSGWHPDDLPKITLNGAVVHGGRRLGRLAQSVVERDALARLVALFRAHGAVPLIYATEEANGHLQYEASPTNPVLAHYLEHRREQVGALSAHGDLLEALPDAALEVGTIDTEPVIRPLTAAIRRDLADRVRVINTRSLLGDGRYYWAEVYHHTCSKGNGVRLLVDALGIAPGCVVAIGDNYNDLDMFEVAAFAVAMQGGPAEVQAAAHRVADPVGESGAAAVLEDIAAGRFPALDAPRKETA
ncbi:MAG TPA: HAD hydrolase family protein [Candidatus Krumholzibacteria bacterium]|nr:HAD hydrolase family protein [Candidatus Krumholzibacteria bacterium]HPD72241.1 HAD hydrolase family protein [Candidatus Krumholzibacteria bacterium]HRY40827.1 HAD hydrolase family protein [Candidatus Krumholzibacteria bacterium]